MARADDAFERVTPASRAEWREWLAVNHAHAPGVWLVYYKTASGMPTVSYAEAVEEALCFGWIDSRPNAIDDERYMQLFSPRKSGSGWSRINKLRIERLIAAGLMMPAGLTKIEVAKADGSWTALDAIEDLIVPADLSEALAANPTAAANFDAFSSSIKKSLLQWVASARRPETRSKRIATIVEAAVEKRNPIAYTPKPRS